MGVASGPPDVNRFSEYMVQITTCFLLLFSWEPLIAQGCLLAMLDCQDVAWNLGRGKSLLDVWSIKDRLKCKKEKEKKKQSRKAHPSNRRKKTSLSAMVSLWDFPVFTLSFTASYYF